MVLTQKEKWDIVDFIKHISYEEKLEILARQYPDKDINQIKEILDTFEDTILRWILSFP